MYACLHTCTHTYIHTYIHTHTYTHTYFHGYIYTYIRTYAHTHTHTHTFTHTHTHTHTHTYTHTHIQTNTHTDKRTDTYLIASTSFSHVVKHIMGLTAWFHVYTEHSCHQCLVAGCKLRKNRCHRFESQQHLDAKLIRPERFQHLLPYVSICEYSQTRHTYSTRI